MGFGDLNGVFQRHNPLLQWRHYFCIATIFTQCILSEGFSQAFKHAVVVNNQTEVFAWISPVGAGDSLHQRVRPHRFVNVK